MPLTRQGTGGFPLGITFFRSAFVSLHVNVSSHSCAGGVVIRYFAKGKKQLQIARTGLMLRLCSGTDGVRGPTSRDLTRTTGARLGDAAVRVLEITATEAVRRPSPCAGWPRDALRFGDFLARSTVRACLRAVSDVIDAGIIPTRAYSPI